jgi:hypothetical protein
MTRGAMMKGEFACHAGGSSLTELVKARMRKSRRTANVMNLAGLIPGHQINYLMLLSDLRDSVLYIGDLLLFFLTVACACVYRVLFFCSVRCELTQA